ncbi:hypothetical protein [Powai lake megavirus]|uniref:Uncharacterized protein n=1 Tax=Powai lake megavirus TaxID=1842663 RepID=A0A167RQN9_9VIRU|nr:hypothetical protein QJ849_gp856 [Powai lake megavirus]ANB51018.1 hypothetical protein [Powai lake megavirus]
MRSTRRITHKSSIQYSSNYLSRRLSNIGISDPYLNRFIRTSHKEKKAYQAELNKWIKAHVGLVNKYEKLANDYGQILDLVSESSAKINNTLDAVVDNNISNKTVNNDKSNESNKITVDDIITYGQGIITGAAISFVIFSRFG